MTNSRHVRFQHQKNVLHTVIHMFRDMIICVMWLFFKNLAQHDVITQKI